jgi:hypothetical protein
MQLHDSVKTKNPSDWLLMCACDWQIKLHDIRRMQLLKRLKLCSIWQLPVNRKLHIRQPHVSLRILNK